MMLKMNTLSRSKLVVKLCPDILCLLSPLLSAVEHNFTESLYQLGKTVGHPLHIYGRWYRSRRYIIGIDTEKISGAGFTGMSTKSGDQTTLNFKDCDAVGYTGSVPTRMYCALHYDAVLNIQDSGVQIMD